MKKILIIDTKAGNLFSLRAAIERLGFETVTLDKPQSKISDNVFDGIVIPGQGRFGAVMKSIRKNYWDDYLDSQRVKNIPMLGICVGMQIFFESSDEDVGARGLAWFKGHVSELDFPKKPMVGWATLNSQLWPLVDVYFVNSFAIKNTNISVADVTYGERFCAAVRKNNFTGVQFHPEKSGKVGSQIILEALTRSRDENNV